MEYGTWNQKAMTEFEDALGSENVSDNPAVRITYRGGGQHGPIHQPNESALPKMVCRPKTVEDIQSIMRIANKHKLIIVPVVGDISYMRSPPLPVREYPDIIVDLNRMNEIIEINPDEGYAVVEAGVKFNELQPELHKYGCWCTSGSFAAGSGVIARFMFFPQNWGNFERRPYLSFEIVLPNGRVIRTGDARPGIKPTWMYQDSDGRSDMADLFIDSYGTMGIITKMAVEINPLSERQEIVYAGFPFFEQAWDYQTYVGRRYLIDGGMIFHWKRMLHSEFFGGDFSKNFDKWYELNEVPNYEQPPPPYHYEYTWVTFCGPEEIVDGRRKAIEKYVKKFGGEVISDKEFKEQLPVMFEDWENTYKPHKATMGYARKQRVFADDFWMFAGPKELVVKYERDVLKKAWEEFGVNIGYYSGRPTSGGRKQCWIRFHPNTDFMDSEEIKNNARFHQEMFKYIIENYAPEGITPGNPSLLKVIVEESNVKPPKWLCSEAKNVSQVGTAPKNRQYWEPHFILKKEIHKMIDPNNIMNPFGTMTYDPDLARRLVREGKIELYEPLFEEWS